MSLSIQEILTQGLGFFILVLLLKKFAWKPILDLLDQRRGKITSEFKNIAVDRKEIENFRTEYQQKLSHIEEEARAKLQEVVHEGKKIAQEIQETARTQAKTTLEKTKADIEIETSKARKALQDEIAGLALTAAGRLIKEKLVEKKDRELILGFINELDQSKKPLVNE